MSDASGTPAGALAELDVDERKRERLEDIENDLRKIAASDVPFADDAQELLDELEVLRADE